MPIIYAIMSGKGGVGKSTITSLLSLILSEKNKVLLLDFDITGPSQKFILDIHQKKVLKGKKGLIPIQIKENLYLISMASLMKDTDSVIWRGPKKLSVLDLFWDSITDEFDYVVIDMPPGLSEEHRFLEKKDVSAFIITTPQNIALDDAITAIDFCISRKIKIFGLIENMSGFRCENCGCEANIFAKRGGELLAMDYGIKFGCSLAIDNKLGLIIEKGSLLENFKNNDSYLNLKAFVDKEILKN